MTIALIITGVLLLPYIYNILFPFKRPNLENYFSPGDQFISKAEGVTQTIIKQVGNKVYCELKFEPKAAGPPEHLHNNIDEFATVTKGTLTVKVNGLTSYLNPGDKVELKKGIYHKMQNDSDEEVILRCDNDEEYVPVEFAYSLAQLYPLMKPNGGLSFKMFLKICVLDDLFDTVPYGPPPAFFNIIKKLVKPYARLLGVTPYDENQN